MQNTAKICTTQHFHHIYSSLSEKLFWKMSFLEISQILGLFFIAYVFPKLQIAKDVVRQMPNKPRFRTPLTVNMLKGPKHC